MINRLFGSSIGNLIYGVIGILTGVLFLVLNLSDPDTASSSDWFWCVAGFVAGTFLLYRAYSKRNKVS